MTDLTAAIIIIGNEILSGRTPDQNVSWIASRLAEMGIRLMEVRIVPDIEPMIVGAVNELRRAYTYVFTTGGIGPTHDDITAQSMAKAFSQATLEQNPEAIRRLEVYYEGRINDARLRMANIPQGATLIDNPISAAPGFQMENVYVMPGVPVIMRAMFEGLMPRLKKGRPIVSRTVTCFLREGQIALELGDVQKNYPAVDIGSYPFRDEEGHLVTSFVVKGTDEASIHKAVEDICAMVKRHGDDPVMDK